MLPKQPYPSSALENLDKLLYLCRKPTLWLFNELVCSLIVIFYHEKSYWKVFRRSTLYCFVCPLVYIVVLFAIFPLFIFGFVCGHVVQHFRQPYLYIENKTKTFRSNGLYSFATANLCLGPEFVGVTNNLPHTAERAKFMGENLAKQQASCWLYDTENHCHVKHVLTNSESGQNCEQNMNGISLESDVYGVCTSFPPLDLICFQEILDKENSEVFSKEIHKHFPYIVYDVRYDGWKSNHFVLNSGLGIASVHPIIDVDFKVFEKKIKFCAYTCKGLLMCKVLLDEVDNKRQVGYVYTSHLQAYQGDSPVIQQQLSQIERCTAEFREQTFRDDEMVMFDVICGDFNLDNMSPADSEEANHPLFMKYHDFVRVRPGKDHDWAVGTERRQRVIHNPEVQTASGLAKSLKDPYYRQLHVLDANVQEHSVNLMTVMPEVDEHGNMVLLPEGGKRRIDYVLHNLEENLSVKAYQFVTQFASQTDHIPVSVTLKS
ncbi:sphingomyelin phosphodiesterase 5-like [Lineus longissimus]|uniref:sphingomyelin phosphodiesterase 5-like n=1 Tax=Lineus longissimus TaxID=88925 RepID=UPI002B4C7F43